MKKEDTIIKQVKADDLHFDLKNPRLVEFQGLKMRMRSSMCFGRIWISENLSCQFLPVGSLRVKLCM